ncbi:MAG: TetR/AcrR family transcriptional regulator [Planctomycetes bacterium]|nr:TetR family transcriptional regulator [Planctomycetota bacterium]MCB9903294.1 TetR/AcrR family transcriptional regulator [Planctomycetota bacterium]
MSSPDTKQRILDTAERLFADKGFAETSLRTLTQEAQVNLAAVHYHFGSKERLFAEILGRIVAPVNAERMRRFDALRAGGEGLRLEAVIEAFLAPAIEFTSDDSVRARHLRQLISRMQMHRESMHDELLAIFGEVVNRFSGLLLQSLPHLDPATLCWRIHFLIGSMCFTFNDPKGIEQLSRGLCRVDDGPSFLDQMVAAFAGAFRAPAPENAVQTPSRPFA